MKMLKDDFKENTISNSFEISFLSRPLKKQIELCHNNEFTKIFENILPYYQPILEAGAGSGRWVIWFMKKGWDAVGIDWSKNAVERAKTEFPDIKFDVGDMRAMPYQDDYFGSIVSLGSIEHAIDGPMKSLDEYYRVLKKNGRSVISVPYSSFLRKVVKYFYNLKLLLVVNNTIRKIMGKNPIDKTKYKELKKGLNYKWNPVLNITRKGETYFYEYRFDYDQLKNFLLESKFVIEEVYYLFPDQGLLHTFGKIIGKFNYDEGRVDLSMFGKILNKLLSGKLIAHHICFIVKK